MAEIKDDGYISLRNLIVDEWKYFILLDDKDEEVYKIELNEENWIHEKEKEQVFLGYDGRGAPIYGQEPYESNQELEFEVVITGDDVESLPVTVQASTLSEKYSINSKEKNDKTREVSKETFENFTFENPSDELTVRHKVNVPVMG